MGKKNFLRNHFIYHDYFARLKAISISLFKWNGLPETCNERFLEECLFRYGQAGFLEDEFMSYLNTKIIPSSELNVYEEPTAFTCFSVGYNRYKQKDECVWIRNNYLAKATETTTMIYAERLARIDLSYDVNIQAQKTPILIHCDDKTKNSLENIYKQYSGDAPVIYVHKSMQEKPLEVLNTNAPFVADKLREEKANVWNDYLEFLGVNTNPSDKKKERLIISEVESNNEEVEIQGQTMLICRQKACEEINKLFGLNVSVEYRLDTLQKLKGEVNNGTVHDRTP